MASRVDNAIKTKEKIYSSAIELIQDKGYKGISVLDITESVGIAKGSFYTYFNSKEDLLYYTYYKFDAKYAETYEYVKNYKSFHDMVMSFFTLAYSENCKSGKNVIAALYTILFTQESQITVLDKNRSLYIVLKKMVEFGLATGELSDEFNVEFYVEKLILALTSCDSYWCFTKEDIDFTAYITEHFAFVLNGLLKR